MLAFQILLIILVASPVVAAAVYMFSQMISYIRKQNSRDAARKGSGTKAGRRGKSKSGRRRK